MKKIYMILAAIALLSLSLNAQTMTADHSNCQVNSMQVKDLSIHSSSNNSTSSTRNNSTNITNNIIADAGNFFCIFNKKFCFFCSPNLS